MRRHDDSRGIAASNFLLRREDDATMTKRRGEESISPSAEIQVFIHFFDSTIVIVVVIVVARADLVVVFVVTHFSFYSSRG